MRVSFSWLTFKRDMPERTSGNKIIGIDWGTMKFLTIVDSFGNISETENPRLMRSFQDKLKRTQRQLSRKKKGSANRTKAKNKLITIHEKLANKREDHLHKKSAEVIKSAYPCFSLILLIPRRICLGAIDLFKVCAGWWS